MDFDLINWSIRQGVEIPKFQHAWVLPVIPNSVLRAHPTIYADDDGTPKTDYVMNWVINPHYEHSRCCQLFSRRVVNLHRDFAILNSEADCMCDFCGNWTIHSAAVFGDVDIMDIVVRSEAGLDSVNEQGETALHLACSEGHAALVEYLLRRGANPNIKDDSGTVPLHICLAKNHARTAELLLRYHARVNEPYRVPPGTTPLVVAVQKNFRDMIELLLTYGADAMARNVKNQSALSVAMENNDAATVVSLVKANKNLVDERHAKGRGPLHCVCRVGRYNQVKQVLECGALVNAEDEMRMTPLHLVARGDDVSLVELLIMYGAEINSHNVWRRTPLDLAIMSNVPKMVVCLLSFGASIDRVVTPFLKAVEHGHHEMVRVLVQKGVSVNVTDRLGQTPLMVAVETGDLTMMDFLLKKGADPNATRIKSKMPMITAAIGKGNVDMMKLLLEAGADACLLDDMHRSPMFHAIRSGNVEVIRVMVETGIKLVMDEASAYLLASEQRLRLGNSFDIEGLMNGDEDDEHRREEYAEVDVGQEMNEVVCENIVKRFEEKVAESSMDVW